MEDELSTPRKESIRPKRFTEETIPALFIFMSGKSTRWPRFGPQLRQGGQITIRMNLTRAEKQMRLQLKYGRKKGS